MKKYIAKLEVSVSEDDIKEVWGWDEYEDEEVERALKEELYDLITTSHHIYDEIDFEVIEE